MATREEKIEQLNHAIKGKSFLIDKEEEKRFSVIPGDNYYVDVPSTRFSRQVQELGRLEDQLNELLNEE